MRPASAAAFALLLLVTTPALAGEEVDTLDRPDLLVYSSSAPRSSGTFVANNGGTTAAFFGNLSAVRNVPEATTGGGTTEVLVGFSVVGYAGGIAPSGDAARLYFQLDEPDSFSRNAKKIAIQQKAYLTMSATGFAGAAEFAAPPVQVEGCSAKATLKDKSGSRTPDDASLKVKCKSIDVLISALGLTGEAAQTVRTIFGTKNVSIKAKDSNGPEVAAN